MSSLISQLDKRVKNPYLRRLMRISYDALGLFLIYTNPRSRRRFRRDADFPTSMGEGTTIPDSAYVSPRGVKIGRNCMISEGTIVLEKTVIEADVTIGPGSIVGSDGYSCKRVFSKIVPAFSAGGVLIRRGARIASRTCIDRGVDLSNTEIGEESFVGDMVHLGHNVRIGKRCYVGSNAMVAGYVVIEDRARVEENASISNMIRIGERAHVHSGSVVTRDVKAGQSISGNFAIETSKHLRRLSIELSLASGEEGN